MSKRVYATVPQTAIHQILKRLNPDATISVSAMNQITSIVEDVAKALMVRAEDLVKVEKKKTLSPSEVQSAVKGVLPGELSKHAVSEGVKAVARFDSVKTGSHTARADLILPVARMETFVRAHHCGPVAEKAPVFLTAVCEYIVTEILALADRHAKDDKNSRITPKHISKAIERDEELRKHASALGIKISKGGVPQQMSSRIIPEKGRAKSKYVDTPAGKKRHDLPGTGSLKDIKEQQKSTEPVFSKLPVERLVRGIAGKLAPTVRFAATSFIVLQEALEEYLVTLLRDSYYVTTAADRETLMVKDITVARRIRGD